MKEYMANKAAGFYLTLAAAVLSLAGIFVYGTVMYRFTPVYFLLGAAAAIEVLLAVLLQMFGAGSAVKLLPVLNVALTASAVVWSFYVMVNQIGYVVAALDPVSTITTFIVYVAIGVIALLLNIVSCFMKLEK